LNIQLHRPFADNLINRCKNRVIINLMCRHACKTQYGFTVPCK
jgi:hypothetical protein